MGEVTERDKRGRGGWGVMFWARCPLVSSPPPPFFFSLSLPISQCENILSPGAAGLNPAGNLCSACVCGVVGRACVQNWSCVSLAELSVQHHRALQSEEWNLTCDLLAVVLLLRCVYRCVGGGSLGVQSSARCVSYIVLKVTDKL